MDDFEPASIAALLQFAGERSDPGEEAPTAAPLTMAHRRGPIRGIRLTRFYVLIWPCGGDGRQRLQLYNAIGVRRREGAVPELFTLGGWWQGRDCTRLDGLRPISRYGRLLSNAGGAWRAGDLSGCAPAKRGTAALAHAGVTAELVVWVQPDSQAWPCTSAQFGGYRVLASPNLRDQRAGPARQHSGTIPPVCSRSACPRFLWGLVAAPCCAGMFL